MRVMLVDSEYRQHVRRLEYRRVFGKKAPHAYTVIELREPWPMLCQSCSRQGRPDPKCIGPILPRRGSEGYLPAGCQGWVLLTCYRPCGSVPAKHSSQVFAADGEKAESWAGRAAKVKQVFPNLQATVRCCVHAGQRSMESAVRSDTRCEQLLDELVLKYSMAGDSKQPGSLARALANSAKLAAMFRRHAENSTAWIC